MKDLYEHEMFFGYNILVRDNRTVRDDQTVTPKYRLLYMNGSVHLDFVHPRANGTLTFDEDENQTIAASLVDVTEHEHLCPSAGVQQKCSSLKFRVRNIASDLMVDLKFWVNTCPIDVEDYERFLLHPTAPSTNPPRTGTNLPRTNTDPLTDPPGTNALHFLFEKPAVQFTTSVLSILCFVFLGTTIIMAFIAYQYSKRKNCTYEQA